jgi:hypothetical protein
VLRYHLCLTAAGQHETRRREGRLKAARSAEKIRDHRKKGLTRKTLFRKLVGLRREKQSGAKHQRIFEN